jgi:probable DNA repair protein
LPAEIQREAGMPHATPQLDWELARTITARLLAAAPEVHFSYARQSKDAEARPSRLVALLAAVPQPLPANLLAEPARPTRTVMVEDSEAIPFPHGKVQGGAKALTLQSQCPFKAFATLRLGADDWAPAQPALTAAQRGQLLHAVLHAVWAGKPAGMRTYDELVALADKRVWVADHVERTMQTALPRAIRERMPARYLELEQQRLVRLVGLWLDYESTRVRFEVLKTEANCTTTVAGLTLDLRIDRLDRLSNGSVLVIDYKTGNVTPALWEHPRPDDVQLPLYAGFALGEEHAQGLDIGGLAFAKVHPSKREFAGHVADAAATLDTSLTGRHSLVTKPFTLEMLMAWRKKIEELARDFLAGCADVYPRDPTKTCDRCGLQTLCRIQENQPADLDEDDQESGFAIAEAADD